MRKVFPVEISVQVSLAAVSVPAFSGYNLRGLQSRSVEGWQSGGNQRALSGSELGGGGMEFIPGCGLRPVNAFAHFYGVEVDRHIRSLDQKSSIIHVK